MLLSIRFRSSRVVSQTVVIALIRKKHCFITLGLNVKQCYINGSNLKWEFELIIRAENLNFTCGLLSWCLVWSKKVQLNILNLNHVWPGCSKFKLSYSGESMWMNGMKIKRLNGCFDSFCETKKEIFRNMPARSNNLSKQSSATKSAEAQMSKWQTNVKSQNTFWDRMPLQKFYVALLQGHF